MPFYLLFVLLFLKSFGLAAPCTYNHCTPIVVVDPLRCGAVSVLTKNLVFRKKLTIIAYASIRKIKPSFPFPFAFVASLALRTSLACHCVWSQQNCKDCRRSKESIVSHRPTKGHRLKEPSSPFSLLVLDFPSSYESQSLQTVDLDADGDPARRHRDDDRHDPTSRI